MSYAENKFHAYLTKIGAILITLSGIVGNAFVFIILTKPKFIKEPIYRKY